MSSSINHSSQGLLTRSVTILSGHLLALSISFLNYGARNWTKVLLVTMRHQPDHHLKWINGNPRSSESCVSFTTYLQKVGSDALVSALLCHLLGQFCHFIWCFCNILGTLDESPFIPTTTSYQARHLSHQKGHPLGSGNYIIALQENRNGYESLGPRQLLKQSPAFCKQALKEERCSMQCSHCSTKSMEDLCTKASCEIFSFPKLCEIKLLAMKIKLLWTHIVLVLLLKWKWPSSDIVIFYQLGVYHSKKGAWKCLKEGSKASCCASEHFKQQIINTGYLNWTETDQLCSHSPLKGGTARKWERCNILFIYLVNLTNKVYNNIGKGSVVNF